MKKATWIVKAYTGYGSGWQEIKRFNNAKDADNWLCSFIWENGYSPADFTIIARVEDPTMEDLEEVIEREEALITKYKAAEAAFDKEGMEKAKEEMRILRGTVLISKDANVRDAFHRMEQALAQRMN